jgi:hypothetical protein
MRWIINVNPIIAISFCLAVFINTTNFITEGANERITSQFLRDYFFAIYLIISIQILYQLFSAIDAVVLQYQ